MEQKLLELVFICFQCHCTEWSVEMLITDRAALCDLILTDFVQMCWLLIGKLWRYLRSVSRGLRCEADAVIILISTKIFSLVLVNNSCRRWSSKRGGLMIEISILTLQFVLVWQGQLEPLLSRRMGTAFSQYLFQLSEARWCGERNLNISTFWWLFSWSECLCLR